MDQEEDKLAEVLSQEDIDKIAIALTALLYKLWQLGMIKTPES